jgi:hypothetical protein
MEIVSNNLQTTGQSLYRTNPTYKSLGNVMNHPEFYSFFERYLKDPNKSDEILFLMRLYDAIDKKSKVKLTPYERLSVMDKMLTDSDMRRQIVSEYTEKLHTEPDIRFKKLI